MKEQISALMDDDLALKDAEYLMTALKAKGETAASWATYHLIAPRVALANRQPVIWSMVASLAAVFFVGLVVLQQQSQQAKLAPVEIAQALPAEYLLAHQSMSPSNAAYFIQPAAYAQDK